MCLLSEHTLSFACGLACCPTPAHFLLQFNLASVTPCTNTAYSLLYADPRTETAREVVRCAAAAVAVLVLLEAAETSFSPPPLSSHHQHQQCALLYAAFDRGLPH